MQRRHVVFMILLAPLILFGLVMDEVLHIHIKEEALWTIPHLIIYLSIIIMAIRVVWVLRHNRRTGNAFSRGFGLMAVTSILLGGIGDTVLHLAYNVQDGSLITRPTHLLIWVGAVIFCL